MPARSLAALRFALPVLALAACPAVTPCPVGDAAVAPFSACIAPEGGWGQAPGMDGDAAVSVAGEVTELGEGEVPDGCFSTGGVLGSSGSDWDASSARWFRVDGGELGVWTIGLFAEGVVPRPELGDTVTVDYSFAFGGFSPDRGRLEARDATGGLLAWVGIAGSAEGLDLPQEVDSADRGAAFCSSRESCGAWQGYEFDLSLGGEAVSIPYGGTAERGSMRVMHGGLLGQTSTSTNCADWFVASARLAVFAG